MIRSFVASLCGTLIGSAIWHITHMAIREPWLAPIIAGFSLLLAITIALVWLAISLPSRSDLKTNC